MKWNNDNSVTLTPTEAYHIMDELRTMLYRTANPTHEGLGLYTLHGFITKKTCSILHDLINHYTDIEYKDDIDVIRHNVALEMLKIGLGNAQDREWTA